MSNDNSDIADIQRRRCDCEDGDNCKSAPDTDQIQAAAERNNEPDGIYGRVCNVVYLDEEPVPLSASSENMA
jgi:hypothetical protein